MVQFGEIEVFEKFGYKRVKITTDEGKSLILTIRDCFSWGVQKGKFSKDTYQIPLVVTEKEDFLNSLKEIKDACLDHLKGHVEVTEGDILRSLHRGKNGSITLYCNLSDRVRLRHESDRENGLSVKNCPKGRQYVHAAIMVESISMTKTSTNLKVSVKEIMFLEKKKEEEEWEDMF